MTFYTADLHFGHRGILAHRGNLWASTEEMDADLVEQWNTAVSPGDTVWVLGDIAMSASRLGPVAQLNGKLTLICGNHDAPWPGHAKPRQHQRYLDAGFERIIPTLAHSTIIAGRRVAMSHLPYTGDHTTEERYLQQRPVDTGLPLLHGHVHDAWTIRGRMINVGVDVRGWAPVREDVIAAELAELPTV